MTEQPTIQSNETCSGEVRTETHAIHLPAPTAWPFLMALGVTLVFASLVTSTVAGAAWRRAGGDGGDRVVPRGAAARGARGCCRWSRGDRQFVPALERVARIEMDETHRAQLPLQTFPISSGIKGGIAGGIAMVIPAEMYGIMRFHSVWYVVNLLGGAGVGELGESHDGADDATSG